MTTGEIDTFFPNGIISLPRKTVRGIVDRVWEKIDDQVRMFGHLVPGPIAAFRHKLKTAGGESVSTEVLFFADTPSEIDVLRGRMGLFVGNPQTAIRQRKILMVINDLIDFRAMAQALGKDKARLTVTDEIHDILSHEFTHLLEPVAGVSEYNVQAFIMEAAQAIWRDFLKHHVPGDGVPSGHQYEIRTKRFTGKDGGERQVRIFVQVAQPRGPVRALVLDMAPGFNEAGEEVLLMALDGRVLDETPPRTPPEHGKGTFVKLIVQALQQAVYSLYAEPPEFAVLYANDPFEVRAFLQQFWLELRTPRMQRVIDKLVRAGAPSREIVDTVVHRSQALVPWWDFMTPDNRKPSMKELAATIERARSRAKSAAERAEAKGK
jgi:hypothetical protein